MVIWSRAMLKRFLLTVLLVVVVVVGSGTLYLVLKRPASRPPSTETIVSTPALVERGRYLATLFSCLHCHTEPDPTRWGGGVGREDRLGAGGLCWGAEQGLPGTVCSKNITPDPETGIGAWTDGEILRAVREGIARDGTALFPIMDYPNFRLIPDDDARAIVAYLRTLKPIKRAIPPRDLKPPLNIVVKFIPRPLEGPVPPIDTGNAVAYGDYLTKVAGCFTCHSPVDERHDLLPGKQFSGGQEFVFLGLRVRSANLTPHETGLGKRTKEEFIAQFRSFADPALADLQVEPAKNTVMPWLALSGASDQDLGAIYDFLRTQPPIANVVEKHPHPALPPVVAGDAGGAPAAGE